MIQLRYGYDIAQSRPVDEIGKIAPRPIFLIHCANDAMILLSQMEQLKAAAPAAQTWVLPSCQHSLGYNVDPAAYEQKVIGFYDQSLK